MKNIKDVVPFNKAKILFYDIETTPLLAYVWRLGKQAVRHQQLHSKHDMYNIICITYCWNDGKPAKALVFDYDTQCCKTIIKEFDALVKEADYTIGKNSDRFDVKQINTQRMIHNLPPCPEWMDTKDDLEKQMRKYFYLPSHSLDYISGKLGFGGKIKMEFQDWIDIVEQNKNGKKSLKKMVKYGKKDIVDTRNVWNYLCKHFKPRLNMATHLGGRRCTHCGSVDIVKNGTYAAGKTYYQRYHCKSHGGYAGRAPISEIQGKIGRIGV